jgi:hypothetical protein
MQTRRRITGTQTTTFSDGFSDTFCLEFGNCNSISITVDLQSQKTWNCNFKFSCSLNLFNPIVIGPTKIV